MEKIIQIQIAYELYGEREVMRNDTDRIHKSEAASQTELLYMLHGRRTFIPSNNLIIRNNIPHSQFIIDSKISYH